MSGQSPNLLSTKGPHPADGSSSRPSQSRGCLGQGLGSSELVAGARATGRGFRGGGFGLQGGGRRPYRPPVPPVPAFVCFCLLFLLLLFCFCCFCLLLFCFCCFCLLLFCFCCFPLWPGGRVKTEKQPRPVEPAKVGGVAMKLSHPEQRLLFTKVPRALDL